MPMTASPSGPPSTRVTVPSRTESASAARSAPTSSSCTIPSRSRAAIRRSSRCFDRTSASALLASMVTGFSRASRTSSAAGSARQSRPSERLAAITATRRRPKGVVSEPATSRSISSGRSSASLSSATATASGAAERLPARARGFATTASSHHLGPWAFQCHAPGATIWPRIAPVGFAR